MKKVIIIGAGSWGTALGLILASKNMMLHYGNMIKLELKRYKTQGRTVDIYLE